MTLFIHSTFLLFSFHILLPYSFAGRSLRIHPLLAGRIFFLLLECPDLLFFSSCPEMFWRFSFILIFFQPKFFFFLFQLVFFKGIPILLQTYSASAYVSSLNSTMLFLGINVKNYFIISICALTVFQSWFPRDGNIVFCSEIILSSVSRFRFSSGFSVLFEASGYLLFRLPLHSVSIQFEQSCFSVFTVSVLGWTLLTYFPILLLVYF